MFFFIFILAVTGIIIQIIEDFSAETYEIIPPFLPLVLHSVTAVHVLTGFSFAVFSVIHILANWSVLKSYFRKKTVLINREVVFAVFMSIVIVSSGIILSLLYE
jgi:cytochrome b subunit of formate dehydrogenase